MLLIYTPRKQETERFSDVFNIYATPSCNGLIRVTVQNRSMGQMKKKKVIT